MITPFFGERDYSRRGGRQRRGSNDGRKLSKFFLGEHKKWEVLPLERFMSLGKFADGAAIPYYFHIDALTHAASLVDGRGKICFLLLIFFLLTGLHVRNRCSLLDTH